MEIVYYKYLDVLRVIAIFMVVVLHVAAQGFYVFGPSWEIALIYNVLGRVAVPVMFMISGACLIPKEEPLKNWFLRIIRRIIVPYTFFSLIYIA